MARDALARQQSGHVAGEINRNSSADRSTGARSPSTGSTESRPTSGSPSTGSSRFRSGGPRSTGTRSTSTTDPKFDPGFGNRRSARSIDMACHADHAHVVSIFSGACCASSRSSSGGDAIST